MRERGLSDLIAQKTGLVLDPYFSASKIAWLLDNVSGARERAEAGQLACGTIDCWLIWNLAEGAVHATDRTNASRTMLFNIHTMDWDDELLDLFTIPRAILPEVKESMGDYGQVSQDISACNRPSWVSQAINKRLYSDIAALRKARPRQPTALAALSS